MRVVAHHERLEDVAAVAEPFLGSFDIFERFALATVSVDPAAFTRVATVLGARGRVTRQGHLGQKSTTLARLVDLFRAKTEPLDIGIGAEAHGAGEPVAPGSEHRHSVRTVEVNIGSHRPVSGPGAGSIMTHLIVHSRGDPRDRGLADVVFDLLSLCCRTLPVIAGGAVSEPSYASRTFLGSGISHEQSAYGAYANAAGWLTPEDDPSAVLSDHGWQVVIPPSALRRLDEDAVARAAERYQPIEWPDGRRGAIARCAVDPSASTDDQRRRWRDVLLPALPPHPHRPRPLGHRPLHILPEDWHPATEEERKRLFPLKGVDD